MKGTLKDKISEIVAIIIAVGIAIDTYLKTLNGGDINWFQLILAVGIVIVGHLTGKDSQGKTKNE